MNTRLRELREDLDLTQKEIADYLICDQSLYSKYELDRRTTPAEVIMKMADYYNTSTDYILFRTDVKEPYPQSKR